MASFLRTCTIIASAILHLIQMFIKQIQPRTQAANRVEIKVEAVPPVLKLQQQAEPIKVESNPALPAPAFPDGHFYSPVINPAEIRLDEERIWPDQISELGLNLNPKGQFAFLTEEFPKYIRDYDYPDELPKEARVYDFYTANTQFSWLDARGLFVMLRKIKPKNMIEVGSGFSSLLTADVNRRFLGENLHFICIEPYPRPFLIEGVPGITKLICQKVQEVPVSQFEILQAGDILFIDSSHVSKTGSDVNYLLFEILPRLKPGVFIHFHDIFFPNDYPKEWVLEERRSWNEQYLIRALLMYSEAFEVIFGSAYVFYHYPESIRKVLNGSVYGGGSLWLQKIYKSKY